MGGKAGKQEKARSRDHVLDGCTAITILIQGHRFVVTCDADIGVLLNVQNS